jgi:hypothetical protein
MQLFVSPGQLCVALYKVSQSASLVYTTLFLTFCICTKQAAIEAGDSGELNRLILKAEKLEMGTEPLVAQAKEVRGSGTTSLCSGVIKCSLLGGGGCSAFFVLFHALGGGLGCVATACLLWL